jgi:hypothetical protein
MVISLNGVLVVLANCPDHHHQTLPARRRWRSLSHRPWLRF